MCPHERGASHLRRDCDRAVTATGRCWGTELGQEAAGHLQAQGVSVELRLGHVSSPSPVTVSPQGALGPAGLFQPPSALGGPLRKVPNVLSRPGQELSPH